MSYLIIVGMFFLSNESSAQADDDSPLTEIISCTYKQETTPWITLLHDDVGSRAVTLYIKAANATEDLFTYEKQQRLHLPVASELQNTHYDFLTTFGDARCLAEDQSVLLISGQNAYFGNSTYAVAFVYSAKEKSIERIQSLERTLPIYIYHNSRRVMIVHPYPYAADGTHMYTVFSQKIGERETTVTQNMNLPDTSGYKVISVPTSFGE